MKPLPIVEVLWNDASYEGWEEDVGEEDHHPLRHRASGELLFQDDAIIVLAVNTSEEGVTTDRLAIPKGCVTKVRRVGWSTELKGRPRRRVK